MASVFSRPVNALDSQDHDQPVFAEANGNDKLNLDRLSQGPDWERRLTGVGSSFVRVLAKVAYATDATSKASPVERYSAIRLGQTDSDLRRCSQALERCLHVRHEVRVAIFNAHEEPVGKSVVPGHVAQHLE